MICYFIRYIHYLLDGASDEKEETNTIKMQLTISSTAHIKNIRLRAKISFFNKNVHNHNNHLYDLLLIVLFQRELQSSNTIITNIRKKEKWERKKHFIIK